jgi:hypothetical protein
MAETADQPMTERQPETSGQPETPAYVSWATLKNTTEKMAREGGVPSQVDRSYLSNLPGSTQSQLIASMKWLGLITGTMKPTSTLERLVESEEADRKLAVKTMLEAKYPGPTSLPALATQHQLETAFREMGVSGSTMRKAIAFYLGAAKYADVPYSQHFKTPKAPVTNGDGPKPRAKKPAKSTTSTTSHASTGQEVAGHLHPLIQGLIQELPSPNGAFPKSKQEDWLELARVTFRLIYKTDGGPAPASAGEDDGGDSD